MRPDIRSYVGKYCRKEFRKTHKTVRYRAPTLPKDAPLAAQNPETRKAKNNEHDEDCLSYVSHIARKRNPQLYQALSASRTDPFSSLPMNKQNCYSQEMMDYGKSIFQLEHSFREQ